MIAQQQLPPMQFDLPPGTMLGKYEIMRKIAMGGMAEIYLARVRGTAGFEKMCVIKRILPTVATDPTFVRMFLDEARLAATLQHPNIADVYEVDEHAGSPFFAMEFIHGQDVRAIKRIARERKEPVPLAIALAIIHGIASALDYAHDRTGPDGQNLGLVHRDVSSSNILVSYEGAIKLIDFGIARATSRTHQTQVGTLKGKIPYMSPEQCRGLPLDRRSDLWSLGVVAYELTTGRRPFGGENDFAVMEQIVHQPLKLPSSVMRNYPPELEAIVAKLLARRVEDRYQTGEDVLADLDPFIAHNRLFVSPKPLSRYMRSVFENEVVAWDQAMEDGVTLAAHAVSSVTANSAQSELHTPLSSFPAVMPLSQEMPAVRASLVMRAEPTPAPAPLPPAKAESAPVYPDMNVRSSGGKRALMIVLGIAALGGGGYVGLTVVQKSKSSSVSASPDQTPGSAAKPEEANDEPKPVETAASAADKDKAAADKAAADKAAADKAAADKAAEDKAAADKAAAVADKAAADKAVAEQAAVEQAAIAAKAKQPIKPPVKKPPVTPVVKQPVKDPPPKKDPPKKDPNQPWDQDSPFLPGQ